MENPLPMGIFGTILLAAWTLLTLYVFGRAASVPWVARRVPRRVLFAAAALLWAGFVVARTFDRDGVAAFLAPIELLGMNLLAILFVCAVPLLAVDLVTGFGLFARPQVPRLRGAALVAGALLSSVALVQGLRPPVVRQYEVRLPGLPASLDGTTIVALSDLHLGGGLGGGWLAGRVAQVAALRPDIVVLLGDLFEGHGTPAENFLPQLKLFSAPFGVWAVTGNHEFHGARRGSDPVLEHAGFTVLHDRWAEVRPGLVLAGVDDLTVRRSAGNGGDPVGLALAGRPPGATVFFSHSPLETSRAAAAGAGLMLSGHTHGGQIWPFGYLVRSRYPYFAGRYEIDGMTLIVSVGTGSWGPRLRLWRPGEILRVTLRGKGRPT